MGSLWNEICLESEKLKEITKHLDSYDSNDSANDSTNSISNDVINDTPNNHEDIQNECKSEIQKPHLYKEILKSGNTSNLHFEKVRHALKNNYTAEEHDKKCIYIEN
ncbi:hypothetical protein A3Q56_07740 [Intoshia linei]|uniref:Uncharacterized protein n=1 Tax=Intoshia linei TaxID=1819745 RepID=A0A177AR84_9BILA|nr:hypothetical protein A3Q56_07740 [Intoshia linei]